MLLRRLLVILTLTIFTLIPVSAYSIPYNRTLDTASTVTAALSIAMPAVLFIEAPAQDYPQFLVSWGTTMITAYGTRSALKYTVNKPRPYLGQPGPLPDAKDDYTSFPSGHTLAAFASATYLHTTKALFYQDTPLLKTATITAWSLAAATAILRVASGTHYPCDVLAGAAIGTALGFLGPYITYKLIGDDPHAPTLVVGSGIGVQVGF